MDQIRGRTVDLQIPNEIVVERDHLRSLIAELPKFGVTVTDSAENVRLGLVRLVLDGAAVTTDNATSDVPVGENVRQYWTGALASIVALGGPAPTNLDVCLEALRSLFAYEYGGWRLTIGKNREFWDMEGLPYISGGGSPSKVPVPASPPTTALRWEEENATEGAGVKVGIADTPIYPSPRLAGRYVTYGTAFHPTGELRPAAGHATFIAGLVLQRAPRALLVVQPVLDLTAHETSWDVATSLMSFLDNEHGVDVLPLAFGTYARDGRPPLVLARAVERLAEHTVVLAAAGNHGGEKAPVDAGPGRLSNRTPAYPAAIDGVCAVAAAGPDGRLASFSPPRDLPWIQLSAPGENVLSLYLDDRVVTHPDATDPNERAPRFDGWACWSGSSFAVAAAAGEIARRTVPGRRTAREALNEILAGGAVDDGIVPLDRTPE